MIFRTESSTYEVDRAGRRIRRVSGKGPPTPRMGEEGEWRRYSDLSEVRVGEPVVVLWAMGEESGLAVARTTVTSPVREVEFLD